MRLIGMVLLALIGVFYLAFGGLYSSVGDFLFFHKAALPAGADAGFRPLYLGLMKLIGGASIALGGLGLWVLFAFRNEQRPGTILALGAAWALPLVGAGYVAETLRAQTGAPTSWNLMGILLAILIVGALLRVSPRGGRDKS